MTFETPLHRQRCDARPQGHVIDASVALDTTDAFVYVNAVIEVHEVRQIVYAHPFDRLAGARAFVQRCKRGRVFEKMRVTRETDLRRRYAGERRLLDGGVAIAAVDSIVGDVMLVAERNRL